MPAKLMRDNPPAKPSSPSAKLTAFVTPTITNRVSGMATQAGNNTSSTNGTVLRRTPAKPMTIAAAQYLPEEFHPGVEADSIVPDPEQDDDRTAKQTGKNQLVFGGPQEHRSKGGYGKRDPSDFRDRGVMRVTLARNVDKLQPPGGGSQCRNQCHADDQ